MAKTPIATLLNWVARFLSVIYVGFVVFMFLGETLPVFNKGRVQHFSNRDILLLAVLALYLASLLLAFRRQLFWGIAGAVFLAIFMTVTQTWHNSYFLAGFIPPVFYVLSELL